MIRALVPAKTLIEAKGRLSSVLTAAERGELVLAMLEDVVTALTSSEMVRDVSVVSPDRDVLDLAARLGAFPIVEQADVQGINEALERAISALSPLPDATLIVLGDVPGIKNTDIDRLLSQLPGQGVAAVPSRDGGTSALATRPAGIIPFRFGPKSFTAHRSVARQWGVEFREVPLGSARLDIDTPADLLELLSSPAGSSTRRFLDRLNLAERLAVA